MIDYDNEAMDRLCKEPAVLSFLKQNPKYKAKSLLTLAKDAGGDALVAKVLVGQKIVGYLPKANMEVVLNKGQKIYPDLSDE